MNTFHISNTIFELNLKPVEILVYAGIARLKNKNTGKTVVSYRALAKLCSIYSQDTVARALTSLENKGLVRSRQRYNIDGRYIAREYKLTKLCGRGFFIVPNKVFDYRLGKSAFAVLMLMIRCADKRGVAVPSLRQISSRIDISMPTLIKALDELFFAKVLIKTQHKKKSSCVLCHNRYDVIAADCIVIEKINHKNHTIITVKVKNTVKRVSCSAYSSGDLFLDYQYLMGCCSVHTKLVVRC